MARSSASTAPAATIPALLISLVGGSRWRGAIYGSNASADVSDRIICYGPQASALFPTVYQNTAPHAGRWLLGFPFVMSALVITISGFLFKPLLVLAAIMLLASVARAVSEAGLRLANHGSHGLRNLALLTWLCWLQPFVRDWARMCVMIVLRAWPRARCGFSSGLAIRKLPARCPAVERDYWSEDGAESHHFFKHLDAVCVARGVDCAPIVGPSSDWDFNLRRQGECRFVTAVTEYHEGRKRRLRVRLSVPAWWRSAESSRPFVEAVDAAAREAGFHPHTLR